MLDISKSINDPRLATGDTKAICTNCHGGAPGLLRTLQIRRGWEDCQSLHGRVIASLRTSYRKEGNAPSSHKVLRSLVKDFATEDGGRHLHQIFPRGPVSQGSRLAGLPEPAYYGGLSFASFS